MVTTAEYIFDRIKDYTISEAGIPVYTFASTDIQKWAEYQTAIANKKIWTIVNFTDLNMRVLYYSNDTQTDYLHAFSIKIHGGEVDTACCNTNPVTQVVCGTDKCIEVARTNKDTQVTDDLVPISVIDEGLKSLGVPTTISINPIYIVGGVAVFLALYYLTTAAKYKIHGSAAKFAGQRYYAT